MIVRTPRACARLGLVALLLAALAGTAGAQQYDTPEEAYRVGNSFLSLRQYAKARIPLEAGLKKANDDPSKLKLYGSLIIVYFYAGETDKVMEALDFILTKSPSEPERTMARRGVINYSQTQGKTDELLARYEDRLKKDPNDIRRSSSSATSTRNSGRTPSAPARSSPSSPRS